MNKEKFNSLFPSEQTARIKAEEILRNLMSHVNQNRNEYWKLIEKEERSAASHYSHESPDAARAKLRTRGNWRWGRGWVGEERFKKFQEMLRGKVVFELGAGDYHSPLCTQAMVVVRVDRYVTSGTRNARTTEPFKINSVPAGDVGPFDMTLKTDMLNCVSRINSNAANFIIDSIDSVIVEQPQYHADLAHEIIRATEAGGVIFASGSDAMSFFDTSQELEIIENLPHFEKVYRKK